MINRIYNSDCIGPKGMCLIEDHSIDLILCDLPYGTTACKWDTVIPFDPLWGQYERIIKLNGSIVLFGSGIFTSELMLSKKSLYKESLVWQKHKPSNFSQGKHRHLKYHEDILVFSISKFVYNPQMQPRTSDRVLQAQQGESKKWNTVRKDGNEVSFATLYPPKDWMDYDCHFKYPSSIITIPAVASNSKEKCNHPTQKPVALFEYLIKTYTNPGDIVLDNCSGSGTTAVACINTNRKFICFENNYEYWYKSQLRVIDVIRNKLKKV